MMVTLTVSLGQLVQLAVTVGGLIALYIGIEKRLTKIETELEPLWRLYERRGQPAGTTGRQP
jgi:hypothetical protein